MSPHFFPVTFVFHQTVVFAPINAEPSKSMACRTIWHQNSECWGGLRKLSSFFFMETVCSVICQEVRNITQVGIQAFIVHPTQKSGNLKQFLFYDSCYCNYRSISISNHYNGRAEKNRARRKYFKDSIPENRVSYRSKMYNFLIYFNGYSKLYWKNLFQNSYLDVPHPLQ